jgi:hypothetical protein
MAALASIASSTADSIDAFLPVAKDAAAVAVARTQLEWVTVVLNCVWPLLAFLGLRRGWLKCIIRKGDPEVSGGISLQVLSGGSAEGNGDGDEASEISSAAGSGSGSTSGGISLQVLSGGADGDNGDVGEVSEISDAAGNGPNAECPSIERVQTIEAPFEE